MLISCQNVNLALTRNDKDVHLEKKLGNVDFRYKQVKMLLSC